MDHIINNRKKFTEAFNLYRANSYKESYEILKNIDNLESSLFFIVVRYLQSICKFNLGDVEFAYDNNFYILSYHCTKQNYEISKIKQDSLYNLMYLNIQKGEYTTAINLVKNLIENDIYSINDVKILIVFSRLLIDANSLYDAEYILGHIDNRFGYYNTKSLYEMIKLRVSDFQTLLTPPNNLFYKNISIRKYPEIFDIYQYRTYSESFYSFKKLFDFSENIR